MTGMTFRHQLTLRVGMFARRDPTDTTPILMPTVPTQKTLVSDEDIGIIDFSGHKVGIDDTVTNLSNAELPKGKPRGKPEMENHPELCTREPWGVLRGSGVVTNACLKAFMRPI